MIEKSGVSTSVTAIIVTHNSPPTLSRVVQALLMQSVPPDRIVIVDSGSKDTSAVTALRSLSERVVVNCRQNIGFAAANNLAMDMFVGDTEYFVLVNPDAVLDLDWIAGAYAYCQSAEGRNVGIVSSPLRGMDVTTQMPTGKWDSLGIYRHYSGRWYDYGQRRPIAAIRTPTGPYEPKAICGALMFIPRSVYQSVLDKHGFLDNRFCTYKEDIDVSLRVARAGYRLVMLPHLTAHHCRGWSMKRANVPYWARKLAARNDVLLAAKHFPLMIPVYIAKLLYVLTIERPLCALQRRGHLPNQMV